MKLNLSQFKKVKDDKHSATLQHPRGHKITISKNALSPSMRDELDKLSLHMDVGGVVPEKTEPEVAPEARSAMPTAPAQPAAQPTIIINNGQQPQQAAPAPQQQQVQPNYVKSGNFDFNQFALDHPESAPIETQTNALRSKREQAVNQKATQEMEVKQLKAQVDAYNKEAQLAGLPPREYPPQVQQALSQAQPNSVASSDMNAGPALPMTAAPQQPQQMQPGMSDPYGTQAYFDNYSSGLNEAKAGIQGQAQAEGQVGQAQAESLQQGITAQEQRLKDFDEHRAEYDAERKKFIEDSQKIDPNRYLGNMGTGQKITTAIGLILGGMGGGLTHQENPAMKFLQTQINNDIEAQKENAGRTKTLLEANFKHFQNMRDATDMTRVMLMGVTENKLKQAAAKAQDPLAKARALQAAGQLDMQAAPILSQMAMRRSLLSGAATGQIDPSSVIRMVVPEKDQQEAYKELKEAQEQIKGKDAALQAFDQIGELNTIGNRVTSPLQTSRQVTALRDNLGVQIARAAAGRVNEYEFAAAKKFFPEPGDDPKTVAIKRGALTKFVQEKMNHPILNAYGIKMGQTPPQDRYGAAGQKKIQLGAPIVESNR